MHNVTTKAEALDYIRDAIAAVRYYNELAQDTFGPIADSWKAKAKTARARLSLAIYCHRENIFEGVY